MSTNVGSVAGAQIYVGGDCFLNDESAILVTNAGTGAIGDSQVYFNQGFVVTGKAVLLVSNSASGTFSGHGINIGDGANSLGGDVLIGLSNNDLFINTNNPTFTINGLAGDDTCSVQSKPLLVIRTNADTHTEFGGAIQNFGMGTSSLMIDGKGSQKLSGMNTFTDLTTIQGGNLILTGSLAGDVLINSLGTFSGTGTAGNVTNLGTISPGESIGTMHYATYTNNGGTYLAEVNGAGASDLIDVAGTATLNGGIVKVASVDGTYDFSTRYTIVEAATVNGTYTKSVGVSPAIRPILSYDAQHVYLTLSTQFGAVARTHNQFNVANQLDSIVPAHGLLGLFSGSGPSPASLINEIAGLSSAQQMRAALDSLSGWQYTTDFFLSQLMNQQFIKRLYDPLRFIIVTDPAECCFDEWNIWIEGGGAYAELGGNPNAHGFHMDGGEVTVGLQGTYCCNWTFGISGSYEHDSIKYRNHGGYGYSNSYFGALYGLYNSSSFYALADLAYGYSANQLNRKMIVGSSEFHAHGKPKISQCTFYGEVGGDIRASSWLIQPFAGLTAGKNWARHIHEKGSSGWEMSIDRKNSSVLKSRLGFHFTTQPGNKYISLDVAWDKRLIGPNANIGGQFEGFGSSFIIDGVPLNSNSIDYALTIGKTVKGVSLYLQGSGETWNKANRFDLLAGLQYSW